MKRIFNVFRSPASSPQSSQQKLPRVDDSDVEGHRPAGTASALPESRRVGEIKATSKLVQSQGKYQGQPQQAADATSTMVAATPKPQELASDSSRRGSAVSVASTRSRGRQASLDMRIAIPQSQRGSVSSQASTVPDRETFQQTLAKAQVDPQYAFNAARYEMGDVLGVGSFGKVVAARDRAMGGREVAIKKLTRKDAAKDAQKLWNELHILSQLQHPNLAALLDWGISGSKVYMVTEM